MRDRGWVNIQIIDYEYEEVDVEGAFFSNFDHEVSRKVRSEIFIPDLDESTDWIQCNRLRRAFQMSFDDFWPLDRSLAQVILRMEPEDAVARIRSTDLGQTPKEIWVGGYVIRTEVFRKVEGVLYGCVRLLAAPVRDGDGNYPGERLIVEWDSTRDRVGFENQGNLNEKIVAGLRIKLAGRDRSLQNR